MIRIAGLACLLTTLLFQASAPGPQDSREAASKPKAFKGPESRPFSDIAKLPKPKEGSIRIFAFRHGQSIGNATQDNPKLSEEEKDQLSDLGKKEAAALAEALRAAAPPQLWHSPARRAKQTAEIAWKAAFPDAPAKIMELEGVRPFQTGKSPKEGTTASRYLVSRWQAGEDPKLEGGESIAELCDRIKKHIIALRIVAGRQSNNSVAFVAHGEVLVSMLANFDAAETRRGMLAFGVRNASAMVFDLDENGGLTLVGYFCAP
jgi:broad specificity phosphatase PhoE